MTDLDRDLTAVQIWIRSQPGGGGLHLVVRRPVTRPGDRRIAYLLLVGPGDDVVRRRLRCDLADVLGWLLVRDPGTGNIGLWVTVTRPQARRELGLVGIEADGPRADRWASEGLAAVALQALGYRTGVRTWDHITVERAPLAGELSAHRRLEAWRRIDRALGCAHGDRNRHQPGMAGFPRNSKF